MKQEASLCLDLLILSSLVQSSVLLQTDWIKRSRGCESCLCLDEKKEFPHQPLVMMNGLKNGVYHCTVMDELELLSLFCGMTQAEQKLLSMPETRFRLLIWFSRNLFFRQNISHLEHWLQLLFVYWSRGERWHVLYSQIISHCLCPVNGQSSSCGEVASCTHVRWQAPREGWGDPLRMKLNSQYERAGALKRMASISGPITFSLTHFQGDLQPCADQAKVRGQGSDWVHISMQVEAVKCY